MCDRGGKSCDFSQAVKADAFNNSRAFPDKAYRRPDIDRGDAACQSRGLGQSFEVIFRNEGGTDFHKTHGEQSAEGNHLRSDIKDIQKGFIACAGKLSNDIRTFLKKDKGRPAITPGDSGDCGQNCVCAFFAGTLDDRRQCLSQPDHPFISGILSELPGAVGKILEGVFYAIISHWGAR